MTMAEEIARLFAVLTYPETLPELMIIVKVMQGQQSR